MAEENKVEKVIKAATDKIKEINGGQVLGRAIKNEKGQTVIPASNMTVAVFCGGGNYGEVKDLTGGKAPNFAGGCAVVCSLKPDSFIINNGNGYDVTKATGLLDNISALSGALVKALKK